MQIRCAPPTRAATARQARRSATSALPMARSARSGSAGEVPAEHALRDLLPRLFAGCRHTLTGSEVSARPEPADQCARMRAGPDVAISGVETDEPRGVPHGHRHALALLTLVDRSVAATRSPDRARSTPQESGAGSPKRPQNLGSSSRVIDCAPQSCVSKAAQRSRGPLAQLHPTQQDDSRERGPGL